MSIEIISKRYIIYLCIATTLYGCTRKGNEINGSSEINYVEKFYNSSDPSKYFLLINLFDEDTTLFKSNKEYFRAIDFSDERDVFIYNIRPSNNCNLISIKAIKKDSFSYIDLIINDRGIGEINKRKSVRYKKAVSLDCNFKNPEQVLLNIGENSNFILNSDQKYIIEYSSKKRKGLAIVTTNNKICDEYFSHIKSLLDNYTWSNVEY